MRALKFTFGGILFSIGLIFLTALIAVMNDPEYNEDEGPGAYIAASVIFAGPPLLGGGFLLWSGFRQGARAKKIQQAKSQAELRELFFTLLQENQGEVSVLKFAMASDLEGEAAREYLDARATEFGADFNVSDRGDITYVFPL
ncbi:MAG: hypothetical protein AAF215_23310 [Cyanobacteria bacterium P01_A01_bin.123]